jgi:hypothetical protein
MSKEAKNKGKIMKNCKQCGNRFTPRSKNHIYCSGSCKRARKYLSRETEAGMVHDLLRELDQDPEFHDLLMTLNI